MMWPGTKNTPGFTGKENGQLKKIEQGWKKAFAASDKRREQKSAEFFARRETQRKSKDALNAGDLPREPKPRRKAKDVAHESKTRNNKG